MALLRHGTGETDTAFADERLARSGPPEQPYTQLPPSTLRSDIDPKAAAAIVDALLAPQVFTRLVNDAGWHWTTTSAGSSTSSNTPSSGMPTRHRGETPSPVCGSLSLVGRI